MPATIGMLRQLLDAGELTPVGGTAFALTPALRESYTSGSTEELEYVALTDAARASLRLLAVNPDPEDTDEQEPPRRVVVVRASIHPSSMRWRFQGPTRSIASAASRQWGHLPLAPARSSRST